MTTNKVKSMWGQDFRVVAEGLAETDVVIFIERLMREYREGLEQLDHVSSLRALATKTVEEAERLASNIRDEARRGSEAASAKIIAEAREKAQVILQEAEIASREMVEAARRKVTAIEGESLKRTRQRIVEIDSALRALKESAVEELSTRMPSHYIGKHLYQGVHFISAFDSLIRAVEAELSRD